MAKKTKRESLTGSGKVSKEPILTTPGEATLKRQKEALARLANQNPELTSQEIFDLAKQRNLIAKDQGAAGRGQANLQREQRRKEPGGPGSPGGPPARTPDEQKEIDDIIKGRRKKEAEKKRAAFKRSSLTGKARVKSKLGLGNVGGRLAFLGKKDKEGRLS